MNWILDIKESFLILLGGLMVLYHFLKLLDTPEVFAVKWYDVWNLYMKIFKQKKKLQDEGGDRQNKNGRIFPLTEVGLP